MQTLNLMPVPSSVQPGSGSLKIDANFTVALAGHTDARLTGAAEDLRSGWRGRRDC